MAAPQTTIFHSTSMPTISTRAPRRALPLDCTSTSDNDVAMTDSPRPKRVRPTFIKVSNPLYLPSETWTLRGEATRRKQLLINSAWFRNQRDSEEWRERVAALDEMEEAVRRCDDTMFREAERRYAAVRPRRGLCEEEMSDVDCEDSDAEMMDV